MRQLVFAPALRLSPSITFSASRKRYLSDGIIAKDGNSPGRRLSPGSWAEEMRG